MSLILNNFLDQIYLCFLFIVFQFKLVASRAHSFHNWVSTKLFQGMGSKNKRQKLNQPSKNYNKSGPIIPDEIIYDILIRVPARDLVSFKRVCKSWKYIISGREFSAAHLKYWKSRFDVILLQGVFPHQDFVALDIRTKTSHRLSLRNLVREDNVLVLDSLDGLILFRVAYSKSQLYVCNPLTQRLKLILRVMPFSPFYAPFRTFYKLVFDSALQKYKVIGFCYQNENPEFALRYCVIELDGDDHQEAQSPVWRNVETRFQHLLKWEFNTVLVNGLLCWLAHNITVSVEERLVYVQALDIVGEEFKEKIKLPCQPGDNYAANCKMFQMENVQGSLCVAIPEDQNELGIWILKDWDEHIWIKKYNICNGQKLGSPFHFSKRFSILFVMDADETEEVKFIVRISGKLGSYSLKGQHQEENSDGSPKFTYVPSLICWD